MLGRQTRISAAADRVIEAGWLLVLVFIPYFFNLLTARHFEPDKATALRSIVLVMLVAWAIKTLERISVLGERPNWRELWRSPLAIPVWIYVGVFLLSTVVSVAPSISWWGGYNRLQGTYTNLSYIALFALIVGNLRTREQLERLITTAILTGLGVTLYGLLQHADLDPLPWKGDTVQRIASTMGNSIFVSAYLIMIVPLVLFRITATLARWTQTTTRRASGDWAWLGVGTLVLLGQQAFLLGQLKFGVAVRTADFRYWWVLPLALVAITASFAMLSRAATPQGGRRLAFLTGGLLVGWSVLLMLVYAASTGVQQLDTSPRVSDWALWTAVGVIAMGALIAAQIWLPQRTEDSRLWLGAQLLGYLVVLVVMLLAVFYSQSRGPQIGLLAGLLLFIDALLLRRWRATRNTQSPRAKLWSGALVTLALAQVVLVGGLIFLNVSDAPAVVEFRKLPYVGRLAELTQTDEGTGRVRVLIWKGDAQGKGALGLITANPLRTIVGYGPETMFTVYNPFYPPELAKYEARGASPDRSHQAELDELVSKGALGLLSFFFLFLSAGVLAWRLLWRSDNVYYQLLYLGAAAAIVAHLFEGLSGIPIVSTLSLLWVSFALLVVGGKLDGLLGGAPTPEPVPVPVEAAPVKSRGNQGGRGARGQTTTARGATRPSAAGGGSFRWMYALLAIMALFGIWFWNLKVVYADMAFNMSQAGIGGSDENAALNRYALTLRSVELAPDEDYYHLQLGNALIQLAYNFKLRQAKTEADMAPPRANQHFEDLFKGASFEQAAVATYRDNSGFQLLEYARLVLERAYNLSPTNKDHPANLGRLNALWYQLNPQDRAKLDSALRWYDIAAKIAPNDVVILNEWASNLALLGDEKAAEVEAKFLKSEQLDPRYTDTYMKLAKFYLLIKRPADAGAQYGQALERNPLVLSDTSDPPLETIIATLKPTAGALQSMADGLQRAVARQLSDDEAGQAAR